MENFDLIETLLWEEGRYFLMDLHLGRLRKSAEHFGFSFDASFTESVLECSTSEFDMLRKYKVRLLFERTGKFTISSEPLPALEVGPVRTALSREKTDRNDIFLAHKTTNRALYDRELKKYRAKGFFDVIFTNRDDEITEGAITNIVIRSGDNYFTPPLSSGVLPGVYREYLLKTQVLPLKEKVLRVEDLIKADDIFLINSVRKMVPAILEP
jgi:para-aminobenzoate synthetase/4-amino-4-deoxychorismate lyase